MSLTIIKKPTPNYAVGRAGYKPEAIVIHIMAGSLIGTDSWFASASSGVSAHYGIGQNGEVHQYVSEWDQAWQAGTVDNPTWIGIKPGINPNKYTIGIEHEGYEYTVWSEAMKSSSAQMVADIAKRWNIPLDRTHIIGHYEIRASKPNCPATNKAIINELISRAIAINSPSPSPTPNVEKAIDLMEEALAILKSN